MVRRTILSLCLFSGLLVSNQQAWAQDSLPHDNGLATYHSAPRYRESESHPLRILAYALHPIGWVAREVIFRPISYFAGSTEVTRSVMGYREPYDYRQPECFSADDATPDCRALLPFNYDSMGSGGSAVTEGDEAMDSSSTTSSLTTDGARQVYFPDVNFDFNQRKLNDLGQGRARQIAALLKEESGLKVVLQGNTDYVGKDSYNEKLGMDRAEALRAELVNLGVSSDRLSTVTFGKSQPIFNEQETWARAVNRRVAVQPADQ